MRKFFGALSGSKVDRCPPFELYNRGKKSIALDINTIEGQALVDELVATADVFITNMRPQFLERVRLDHETLLKKYPRLVYASLTAYGLTGPDRDAPGYDHSAFQGRTGVADRATPPGAVPTTLPGGMGDNITAITTVAGIMGALFHRTQSGRGQLVASSLLRTGIYSIGMDVSTRLGLGRISAPPVRTKPSNPLFNLYKAADDKWFWLAGTESERHWPKVVKAFERPDLAEDERFATPRDRRRNATELVAAIESLVACKTRNEWAVVFREHDVWWAPVSSVEEVLHDPQAMAAGAFVKVPGQVAAESIGDFNGVATPIDFGGTPIVLHSPPPAVGADADSLLQEIGYSGEEIKQLRSAGVLSNLVSHKESTDDLA
jgi:crotonobetainyl-CoA:carnitine CoA-transferase CaiB-like acyl-CoA transferase